MVLVAFVRQVDADVLRRVAEGEHRIEAFFDLLDLPAQRTAIERDAAIGRAKVFSGAVELGADEMVAVK